MILILGGSTDKLANEVNRRLKARGLPVFFARELELYSTVPFKLERSGKDQGGFIRINGIEIQLSELSGVLIRLPRAWWPSCEFNLQDQMFVYHETTALWFSLLASLSCLMINRFALGWWLQDLTYPEFLRKRLAEQLKLETSIFKTSSSCLDCLLPTPACNSFDDMSVYLVGKNIMPRLSRDNHLVNLLKEKASALTCWQEENGIMLCRLDFENSDKVRIKYVEVFPLFENESIEIIDQIIKATMEILI